MRGLKRYLELDAISKQRALSETESLQLERLSYRYGGSEKKQLVEH